MRMGIDVRDDCCMVKSRSPHPPQYTGTTHVRLGEYGRCGGLDGADQLLLIIRRMNRYVRQYMEEVDGRLHISSSMGELILHLQLHPPRDLYMAHRLFLRSRPPPQPGPPPGSVVHGRNAPPESLGLLVDMLPALRDIEYEG